MRKSEFMLGESFSATGRWWLPENPDVKVYGTLNYSRTKIELVLSGEFETVPLEKLMIVGEKKFKDRPCIHGLANDREKFTLLQSSCSLSGQTTNYAVRFVIVGEQTTDAENIKIASMSLYCSHLDSFLVCNVLGFTNDGERESLKSVTIEYKHPEKLRYRINPINAAVDFQVEPLLSIQRMKHAIEARALIHLTPDTPQNVFYYLSAVWKICYLLTLLTDERVSPTGMIILLESDKYVKSFLCAESSFASPPDENSGPLFLFHFGHIAEQFQGAIDRWFSVPDTLLEAIQLTMDAHRNEYHSIQGRFLMLAQAVEVTSRTLSSSKYMSEEDFKEVTKTLAEAIPRSVSSDHRQSLAQRISFLYEYSFKKRIVTLLNELLPETVGIICMNTKEFAAGVADTRNYFTHYTDDLRKVTLKDSDLFWASEKLLLLLRIIFIKHLGIDEKLIVDQIKDHHRLMQRIVIARRHKECVKTS
ncbi:MAG: hypothetical protein J0M17_12430 [Planctomycetes bacterium]|nr:hypothetical protein [Planctomycetota bacterium]